MTFKEVKDENKDTDGSPEVKQKIRRLQNEISQRASTQTAALENVKDASAIITNPTHFAVAIKYEVGKEGAPIIIAMGRGMMAEKIISLAGDAQITVFQSPLLARAIYFTGEIGKEISENLYSAVASVLAYIFKIERGEESDYPEFDVPDEMSFDEYGKNIK
jgi:flagellar biosynthetic protein FlhB